MSYSLTKEQKQILDTVFTERWLSVATDNKTDFDKASSGIKKIYKEMKYDEPLMLTAKSPEQASVFIDLILKNPDGIRPEEWDKMSEEYWDKYTRGEVKCDMYYTYVWGNQDSWWIQFYDFAKQEGLNITNDNPELVEAWREIADGCSYWYPFKHVCIMCEKPTEIHYIRREDGNYDLHREDGPALVFSDGTKRYSLFGVNIPGWTVETPREDLDYKKILTLSNAEQRTTLIRWIGIENFLDVLDTELIDQKLDKSPEGTPIAKYELIRIKIENEWCNYLKMINPSIPDHIHVEGIPNVKIDSDDNEIYDENDNVIPIKTVDDALAWRFGIETFENPVAEA